MLTLDHITVVAATLAEGAAYVEAALGVPLAPGGRHPLMGTHNRLLRLGEGMFLEVIARDPDALPVGRSRWFGLDESRMQRRLQERPFLATWVARSDSISEVLALVPDVHAPVLRLTRGDLAWRMTVPEDGSMLFDGAFPALIEWEGEHSHPATRLPDQGCALTRLAIEHPDGIRLAGVLSPHLKDGRIHIGAGENVRLRAEISTPHGTRVLE